MVRLREHKLKSLTRPVAGTELVCANLPADVSATKSVIMLAARRKEAAP